MLPVLPSCCSTAPGGQLHSAWRRSRAALLANPQAVRDRQEQWRKALKGCRLSEHFRFLLCELLDHVDRLSAKVHALEKRTEERIKPCAEIVGRLCDIPGIDRLSA